MQVPGRRYPTRIREACSSIGDPYATHEGIEDERLLVFQCIRLNMAKQDLGSIGEK